MVQDLVSHPMDGDEDCAPLGTNVDGGVLALPAAAASPGSAPTAASAPAQRRRIGKQAPHEAKVKAAKRGRSAAKAAPKKKGRRAVEEEEEDDDDDDEGGYDDSDSKDDQKLMVYDKNKKLMLEDKKKKLMLEDKKKLMLEDKKKLMVDQKPEADKKLDDEKPEVDKNDEQPRGGVHENDDGEEPEEGEKKPKKKKGKGRKQDKGPLRDQSKSKKFTEIWRNLSADLRHHFNGLSRSDQTQFIHCGIQRQKGRLVTDEKAMLAIMKKREHTRSGKDLMSGFILEELMGK